MYIVKITIIKYFSGSFQFGIVSDKVTDLTNLTSNHGAYINDDMKTGYFGKLFESKMIEGQPVHVIGKYCKIKNKFLGFILFFCTKIASIGSSITLIFFFKPTGMEKVNDVVIPIFSEPHGSMFKFAHAADGTFNDGQGKKFF